MIFTAFVGGIIVIFNFVTGLFPIQSGDDVANIVSIQNGFSTVRSIIVSNNFWFPIDDLFIALHILIYFYLAMFTIRFVLWIASNSTAGILKK